MCLLAHLSLRLSPALNSTYLDWNWFVFFVFQSPPPITLSFLTSFECNYSILVKGTTIVFQGHRQRAELTVGRLHRYTVIYSVLQDICLSGTCHATRTNALSLRAASSLQKNPAEFRSVCLLFYHSADGVLVHLWFCMCTYGCCDFRAC